MWSDETLAEELSRGTACKLVLASAKRPCSETKLTEGEKAVFRGFNHLPRKLSWLRGRMALKLLLSKTGGDQDTSRIYFPNENYSLTHSGSYALGVFSHDAGAGIGIDFEENRFIQEKAIRYFLGTREENGYARSLKASHRQKELLRLWTLKEALFKSDLGNFQTWYTDYMLESPGAMYGNAACLSSQKTFRYVCAEVEEGYVSLAIAMGGGGHG